MNSTHLRGIHGTERLERLITRLEFERDSKSVTLVLRVKHEVKWRRYPAAYGGNGGVKPGHALIDGKPVRFEQPANEIRFIELNPLTTEFTVVHVT